MLIILLLLVSAGSMSLLGAEAGKDRFASMPACVAAVKAGEFENYNPSFLNRHREAGRGEEVRTLEERACVEMDVVGGRGFVPQPKGEKFIFTGTQPVVRYDCGNKVYSIEYIPVPPPPPLCPCPPPQPPVQVVVDIPLPTPPVWVELVELPPLPPPPPPGMVITLIWDEKGKCWVWKYTPLWCVDVRTLRDLYKPAVCGGLAVAGYWLAGGFAGVELIKPAFLRVMPTP